MNLLPIIFFFLGALLYSGSPDHLLLIRIVTQPDAAESLSIYNPTDSPIDLTNYYICDDEEYYKIQTEGDLSPSSSANGFTAQFPPITIDSGDTLNIVLNENYTEFFGENFVPDLLMFGSDETSMVETKIHTCSAGPNAGNPCEVNEDCPNNDGDGVKACVGSIGIGSNKIKESSELIILFKWDSINGNLIEDIDYFLWGVDQTPINKTGVPGYKIDTSAENQLYFESEAATYYAYSRIGTDEIWEIETGGNGITENDETSENFRASWEIIKLFNLGCMDSEAPNFDPFAEFDDGSCYTPFSKIISGVYDCGIDSRNACEDGMPSSDAANCQLVNIEGKIVSFGDYSYANGPYALVVEDEQGYRLELTIWPNTWNILTDENYSILTIPPFFDFVVNTFGNIYTYNGKRQVYVCGPNSIQITQTYNTTGVFIPSDTSKIAINPEPFILIPTLGENLNFTYTFPENSRVIIRIYDLSGRFITSLEDKYFEEAGTIIRNNLELNEYGDGINSSAWDGRDYLGQIVAPGTYIMHMEVMNPVTGETQKDAAPVVVGVKN